MIVNLTPHTVTVYGDDDQIIITVPSSGAVARLAETTAEAGQLLGVPITEVTLGGADGMPPVIDGTTYIVSMPMLMGLAAAGVARTDLVYPFGQVRDEAGRIIGCRSLARLAG